MSAKNTGVHNVMEGFVFTRIDEIYNSIQKEKKSGSEKYKNFCCCAQCRIDAACYVLNRTKPHYIASGRGVIRTFHDSFERQQIMTDISISAYKAIEMISRNNRRPECNHELCEGEAENAKEVFFYDVPAVVGRVLNGSSFTPMFDVKIELLSAGNLVKMRNENWQNPCDLVKDMEGTYTFWPEAEETEKPGEEKNFNYTIKIEAPGYETVNYNFSISSKSVTNSYRGFSITEAYKINDIYLFHV
ncbi:MAG: late competence development ComFB family protein [Spirochaetaceae bacterium]|jgi:competence protein ComFB|nr:late competence development ComFB family protein [Spirochaetaceae bacterium]